MQAFEGNPLLFESQSGTRSGIGRKVLLQCRVILHGCKKPWLNAKVASMQDGAARTLNQEPSGRVSRVKGMLYAHICTYMTAPMQWLALIGVTTTVSLLESTTSVGLSTSRGRYGSRQAGQGGDNKRDSPLGL